MKKLLPLLLLILIGCSKEPINMNEMLVERNGVYYTKDTNQPYSGPVFSLSYDGKFKVQQVILKNGKKDGPYKWYFDNRKLKEEGTYINGELNGNYKSYNRDGQLIQDVNFNNGIKDGPYKWYFDNRKLKEEGTYINGELNGNYKSYNRDGQLIQDVNFNNGIKDGPFQYFFDNGKLEQEGTYKDGKWIGVIKSYYKNGNLLEQVTYSVNEKEEKYGVDFRYDWIQYHDNGLIKDYYSFGDKKDGVFQEFHYNGQTSTLVVLKDDKHICRVEYFSNGQIISETFYLNGTKDGVLVKYYPNGLVEVEYEIQDGKKTDKINYYFTENGYGWNNSLLRFTPSLTNLPGYYWKSSKPPILNYENVPDYKSDSNYSVNEECVLMIKDINLKLDIDISSDLSEDSEDFNVLNDINGSFVSDED